jgi:DNA-binding response OmpR family regulator
LIVNKEIMVVDDETHILTLIDIMLRRGGFTVIKANNPFAALEMLNSSTPDLFILDVMMPGMDGIELCKRIRSRPQTAATPVLILSAIHDVKSVERGMAAGASDYLPKTVTHNELIVKVRATLGIS